MARIKVLNHGRKRRVRQIHWRAAEIAHAVVMLLLMMAFCVWLAVWLQMHPVT